VVSARRTLVASVSLAASVAVAGCVVERSIDLELARGSGGLPAGFFCRAPSATGGAPYLIEQVASRFEPCAASCGGGECRSVGLVFDFIETGGGLPGCRAGSIAAFCESSPCAVTVRRCFDAEVCLSGDPGETVEAVDTALRNASGGVILEEAPDGPVLIRMIGTAQGCDEVRAEGLDARATFGCAYSCPAQLDAVEGTVQLDLDAFDDECGSNALACALFLSGQDPVVSR
jgi:hypothetical protein